MLLRGLARESAHWGAFPELLRRRLPGASIATIDLPGTGALHAARSPARVEAMTRHCRQQLGEIGFDAPVYLIALSLGAMVAVDWADRHPDELAGCALINTSLRAVSPWFWRLRPSSYPAFLAGLAAANVRSREARILRLTSRDPHQDDGLLDRWAAIARTRPVSRANALRQLWAAARYRTPVTTPAVPLLLVASLADRLVDPRCSQQLALNWNAALLLHPDAGHDLPLDDAPWLADQVAHWAESRKRA